MVIGNNMTPKALPYYFYSNPLSVKDIYKRHMCISTYHYFIPVQVMVL